MAQSSQSNLSRSPFCIHVFRTTLNTALKPRGKFHIAVTLPSTEPFRSHSLQSECDLEWNRRYEFTSLPSHAIKFQLVIEGLYSATVHGEAQIRIEELLHRCRNSQDCTLELLKPSSGKVRGLIVVRLEQRPGAAITHALINKELSQLEQDERLNARLPTTGDDDDPMETLRSLLDRMKPFIRVLGTASTIHPIFENTWESVSSLCKAYQKMKTIDVDIRELVRTMRNALKFVQNSSSVEYVLSRSERTVEKLLRIIFESSQRTREYLEATKIRRVWRTDSTINVLREYKRQVYNLSVELHGDAIANITDKLESTGSKRSHVVVPPPPSDIFTSREDYLTQMEQSFDLTKTSVTLNKQRKIVLYGIGGMGKTQLALKFRERNSDKFTKQYMIDASSEESIDLSFASIGNDLGIQDADRSKVFARLSQLKEDWLLIYDNADNPEMRLSLYFPKVAHGNIIVTTRNSELGRLAPNGNIEVLMLDDEAAIHLLLRSSELEENEENRRLARTLVTQFGCLALAIVHAGSYIATRRLDLNEYLKIFQKSPSTLLRTKLGQEVDYKSPVFTTWEISYDALGVHAQELLNICSFLYRDGITRDIFRLAVTSESASDALREQQVNDPNISSLSSDDTKPIPSYSFLNLIRYLRNEDDEWDDYQFRELMHNLCSYSLVQSFGGVYSIHPLVHEWVRDSLEASKRETVKHDTWLLLYYSTPSIRDREHISVCRMLLPHISSCGRLKGVTIMEAFAEVYIACGRWKDAEILQLAVVEWSMNEIGEDRKDTLLRRARLATIYWNQGRWAESEKLGVEVLEATKQVLGPDHPSTLTSMANLALTYWNQGRWAEAEKLQVEVVEARKQLLGPDHPNTLTSMQNLASIYWDQGRWAESEKLGVGVLEAAKQVLGPDHPGTLTSMANLALTYLDQGRWSEAEKLGVKALEATKQLLGPDHPDTLISMHNLASTYQKQGRWAEAEKLEVEVLEVMKQLLGPDHPNTLNSMANLALTLQNQGRWAESEKLEIEVLEARKQVLGPDHPNTLNSMNNLALTYQDQGRWVEAERLGVEVLEARKQLLGPDHQDTIASMNNLASTYRNQDRWAESEKLGVEVLEKYRRVLGPNHPDTLTSMANLAETLQPQGRLNEAVALLGPAVESSKCILGPEHPDTVQISRKLLSIYHELDEVAELKASLLVVDPSASSHSNSTSDSESDTQ